MSCINTSRSGRKMLRSRDIRTVWRNSWLRGDIKVKCTSHQDQNDLHGLTSTRYIRVCKGLAQWILLFLSCVKHFLRVLLWSCTEPCSGVNLGVFLGSVCNLLLFSAFQPFCRKQQHSKFDLNSWKKDSVWSVVFRLNHEIVNRNLGLYWNDRPCHAFFPGWQVRRNLRHHRSDLRKLQLETWLRFCCLCLSFRW